MFSLVLWGQPRIAQQRVINFQRLSAESKLFTILFGF